MTNTELLGILSTVRQHRVSMKHFKIDRGHDIMFQAIMRKVSKHATDEVIREQIAELRAAKASDAHSANAPASLQEGDYRGHAPTAA